MATEKTQSPAVREWLQEIEAAQKREKNFRKDGHAAVKLYECEKATEYQFNILFSNTETLAPAVYNNIPRPVVERRFKDPDPVGAVASAITRRTLEFLIDSNNRDYSSFDDLMKSAVLESLVPGRGVTRFKYEADIAGEGDNAQVKYETVCGEEICWDRVLFGYAKKWKDVPWVAFEHFMTKQEVEKNFGESAAAEMDFTANQEQTDEENERRQLTEETKQATYAHVLEIWDKSTKKVLFISPGSPQVLREAEDPLGLSGFFPIPRPLAFMAKISTLVPTNLYKTYEEQAKELNHITLRINKIMRAMKVRGFYDSTLDGVKELMSSEDNTLLPAENVANMLQGQTLDRAIWLFPIEKLVGVLQQLYVQRDQIKNVIYEITGISDILRGASVASETATAQNIKNQWGTLRLKRFQKEVMRYVRDCLRLMAEIAVTKLSQETLQQMTGLVQIPTAQQKAQAQQILALAQQSGQQPDPAAAQMLQSPSWEEALSVLREGLTRNYRIDIETNSTVDAEATEDKADVAEFMNAMSQFMNGMMPLIEQGLMPFETAKVMMLAVVRKFRFGTEVEDQIKQMAAPQPREQGEDPKMAAEKQKAEMEVQVKQMEMDAKKAQLEQEAELARMEMELKREEHRMKMEELQMKQAQSSANLQMQAQTAAVQHESAMAGLQRKEVLGQAQAESAQRSLQVKEESQKQGLMAKLKSAVTGKKGE